jgi:uncharacterized protein (TIGR00299 family) protein
MPTLVYNCPSGISGDMNLGAMIGLGVEPSQLEAELRKLPYTGWHLHFDDDQRGGISGTRATVHLKAGSEDSHSHGHDHGHDHGHSHEHHHRTFSDIREAIVGSTLSDQVKEDSIACFRVLAEAEGAVHGIAPEAVHFHEVGAIDSIVDMVGAAICWELLGVERLVCRNLEVGGGTVDCAHGRMPVPAPATARILDQITFSAGATNKETTTPTGAALLVGKGCEFTSRTHGRQIATAIGVGQRDDPNLPNVLYASLIDESAAASSTADEVWELVTNIDDMCGEATAFLCEQILAAGALDCWHVPAFFKKSRPGILVHALCSAERLTAVESAFFQHSETIGLRRQVWRRSKLARTEKTVESEFGPIRIKISSRPDGTSIQKYEYEDCARIAREHKLSISEVRKRLDQN